MKKKKVLVCGATGFIGRNILERLAKLKNFELHATFNKKKAFKIKNVNWHQANLLKKKSVDKVFSNKDIVIQCAAVTSGIKDIADKPYIHITDNVVLNSLMLRGAHDHKIKHFIFFSCTLMYHNSHIPLRENDYNYLKKINPKYFGGAWNKLYFEKMCQFFSNIGKTKYTVIRHSNVYGPYDKFDLEKSHVFGATVTKVFRAEKSITVWGDGKEKRDLLYIDDLVRFVCLALQKQKKQYELMNCGLGKAISVKNLVKKIIKFSGKDLSIEFDNNKPNVNSFLSLNCEYAQKKIGWKPLVDIDAGIRKTIEWYKKSYL